MHRQPAFFVSACVPTCVPTSGRISRVTPATAARFSSILPLHLPGHATGDARRTTAFTLARRTRPVNPHALRVGDGVALASSIIILR